MKIFLKILTMLVIHTLLATHVSAQSAGLSISPPVIEILLAPSKKVVQALTLKNQGENNQFVVNIHAVTPNGNEGHVTVDPTPIDPGTIPLSLTVANRDIELGRPFTIAPGSSTQIVLNIQGASTDVTQDVYLALVVRAVSDAEISVASPAISSLLLITLTANNVVPIDLSIENFETPIIHDTSDPLPLAPHVVNSSTLMVRPYGELEIISPKGNHNKKIKLYPNLVLGGSSRKIVANCPSTEKSHNPQPCNLVYKPSWYNLGPYKFRLIITTQGGTKIQEVEKIVWLFPIKAFIIIVVGVTIVITLALRVRKRST